MWCLYHLKLCLFHYTNSSEHHCPLETMICCQDTTIVLYFWLTRTLMGRYMYAKEPWTFNAILPGIGWDFYFVFFGSLAKLSDGTAIQAWMYQHAPTLNSVLLSQKLLLLKVLLLASMPSSTPIWVLLSEPFPLSVSDFNATMSALVLAHTNMKKL